MTSRTFDNFTHEARGNVPDTRTEGVAGFKAMRAFLEGHGFDRAEAEDWSRMAVGAFRNAVLRGRPVADAYLAFFGPEQAALYVEARNGIEPKERRAS